MCAIRIVCTNKIHCLFFAITGVCVLVRYNLVIITTEKYYRMHTFGWFMRCTPVSESIWIFESAMTWNILFSLFFYFASILPHCMAIRLYAWTLCVLYDYVLSNMKWFRLSSVVSTKIVYIFHILPCVRWTSEWCKI